ncbi:PREDICTED: pannexin-1-like [Poecilia mexicana]|uniref:Pannexin n=2 Tax=Poecilia TaxID=8080 RepID=A0A087Y1R8_POEFO|nr:PREDICTED: pannexin-1-like [Poecilia formosa]XP_007552406.1 PREDICTED: pannexin-1-like [Poecilia formosa]XP_014841135.1 PREDICTED: pannexin-1-like [Poecilia mexicana]XP_014841136.1 PREDICTED: pannexin-1-like [Poecilia mexicana]
MAIAHVATEYVFSDFRLKEPNQARYQNIRTELAADKMVTCVAVGLPLLFISLAFAQEVSVGTQISCFSPTNFSWKQAGYVDSYCWAAVHNYSLVLGLHKFFPYILLLVAVLMYSPALFWRFSAAPLLQSDLAFIMEELDRCYNRAVTLAKRLATSGLQTSDSDLTEGCFNYPLVEKFLMTKRCSRVLLSYYLLCRGLTLVTLLCACLYLGYYLHLASIIDQFDCLLRVGLLVNDTSIPERVQCKLIAVGVFSLLSAVNLAMFIALIPVVIYASLRPLFCQGYALFLETYQSLPTVSVLPTPGGQWDDLSLYLLYLEENISELKSYKYMKVLEMLKKRGECAGENFDTVALLQTLCLVKMDTVDGKKAPEPEAKPDGGLASGSGPVANDNEPAKNNVSRPNNTKTETEMKELRPLLPGIDETGSKTGEGGTLRQRVM